MPSRDHYSLYSIDLSACTTDAELHRLIEERDAYQSSVEASEDLDIMPVEESIEELLAFIEAMPDPDATADASSKVTEPASSEVMTPPVMRSSKVTETPSKSPSSKVTRRFRSSITNDLQTIQKIKGFGKSLPTVNPVPLVAISTPSKTTPLTPPKAPSTSSNDNSIPLYEKGSDLLKLTMANEVLETSGAPVVSCTLDLTPAKIRSALSHRSGFTGSLADDLKRALMRELGRDPLFWFHVDISKAGNLHLHGAVETNTQEHDGLERALRHVGGHGPKSENDDYMVDLNPRRCDEGWVIYASRNRGAVRKALGEKAPLYTISRPLRLEAANLYGWIRRVMRTA